MDHSTNWGLGWGGARGEAPLRVHSHLITSSRQKSREHTEAWELVRSQGAWGKKRLGVGVGELWVQERRGLGLGFPVPTFLFKEEECTSGKSSQCTGEGPPPNVCLFPGAVCIYFMSQCNGEGQPFCIFTIPTLLTRCHPRQLFPWTWKVQDIPI